jgi:hypothetical protein
MSNLKTKLVPMRTVKFKMYKAKKQWMMAALAFISGAAMIADVTTVSADSQVAQAGVVQTEAGSVDNNKEDFSASLVNNQTIGGEKL